MPKKHEVKAGLVRDPGLGLIRRGSQVWSVMAAAARD